MHILFYIWLAALGLAYTYGCYSWTLDELYKEMIIKELSILTRVGLFILSPFFGILVIVYKITRKLMTLGD